MNMIEWIEKGMPKSKKPFMAQCCVCKKYRDKNNEWIEENPDPDALITHTYCSVCAENFKKELEKAGIK